MTEIVLMVEGLPPAKSEASSMLSFKHAHSTRVRELLLAARQAIASQDLAPLVGPIGLDVVISVAQVGMRTNATNFLGGIADVLQAKTAISKLWSLDHLGDLAGVWLYE